MRSDMPQSPTMMETKPCKTCHANVMIRVDRIYCFLCWRDKYQWEETNEKRDNNNQQNT